MKNLKVRSEPARLRDKMKTHRIHRAFDKLTFQHKPDIKHTMQLVNSLKSKIGNCLLLLRRFLIKLTSTLWFLSSDTTGEYRWLSEAKRRCCPEESQTHKADSSSSHTRKWWQNNKTWIHSQSIFSTHYATKLWVYYSSYSNQLRICTAPPIRSPRHERAVRGHGRSRRAKARSRGKARCVRGAGLIRNSAPVGRQYTVSSSPPVSTDTGRSQNTTIYSSVGRQRQTGRTPADVHTTKYVEYEVTSLWHVQPRCAQVW